MKNTRTDNGNRFHEYNSRAETKEIIQLPPNMRKQPLNEIFFQIDWLWWSTENITLECEATGHPIAEYKWFKNGFEINYTHYMTDKKKNNGSLVIKNLWHSDSGLYQCFAYNKYGTAVSNVAKLCGIKSDYIEINVTESEPLSMKCNIHTHCSKLDIKWFRESKNGSLTALNNDSRLSVDSEGGLHFSSVSRNDFPDSITYNCYIQTMDKMILVKVFNILLRRRNVTENIRTPLTLQYISPSEVIALSGQQLELHCIYGGTPIPEILWFIDYSRFGCSYSENCDRTNNCNIKNYGRTIVVDDIERSLLNATTLKQFHIIYNCNANDSYDYDSILTHSIHIKFESIPVWIRAPKNTNITAGQNITFECLASGIPKPVLQWYMNGIPIEKVVGNSNRIVKENTIYIENVSSTVDTAVYQCNASNIHGYVFTNFYLNVLKPVSVI